MNAETEYIFSFFMLSNGLVYPKLPNIESEVSKQIVRSLSGAIATEP
jgi:hypothetical protein